MAYDKNKKKDSSFIGYEVPVDVDNESVVISTMLGSDELRGLALRKLSFEQFRSPETRAIFWSINEIVNKKLELNFDMILVQANYCPARTVLTFEAIDRIAKNFPIDTQENLEVHMEKLVTDDIKSKVLSGTINDIVKKCMDPSKKIMDVQESVQYLNRTLDTGRSASICEFKSLAQLTPQFLEEKEKGIAKRTTGFAQLDHVLTDGLKEKTVTIIAGLCLSGDSSIYINRGKRREGYRKYTLADVYGLFNGYKGLWNRYLTTYVMSLNDSGVFQKHPIQSVIASGDKEVFEVTTKSGKKLKASAEHRFKSPTSRYADSEGFVKLKNLVVGDIVVVKSSIKDIVLDWDEVISIISKGVEPTYDIICDDPIHNFVANDFVVHNSGMGKSSLSLSMIKNLAHKQIPTGLFALEMNNMSVYTKLLAYGADVDVRSVVKPVERMSTIERELFENEIIKMSKNKLIYINDKPQQLKLIEQQTMMLQDLLRREYIPIFIDLFGKIRDLRGSDNLARDYEHHLNETQEMAKRLNVPLILVAQINRAVMQRKNKRPTMQDIKNAGAFEEVADLILGVHRPNYNPDVALEDEGSYYNYWEDNNGFEDEFQVHHNNMAVRDPSQDIAEVIVLKQRNGQGNRIVNFYFNPKNTCYEPITRQHQHLINQTKDFGEGSF